MLNLLGDSYISQHIYGERYRETVELTYRVYMTDCMKAVARAEKRWYPRIASMEKPEKPQPTVSEMLEMVHKIK